MARSGDPLIAKKSETWTTKNAPWNLPVQTEVGPNDAAPTHWPPASDNGLYDTAKAKREAEGSLREKMRGFSEVAGDFDVGNGGRGTGPRAPWNPRGTVNMPPSKGKPR